MRLGRCHLDIRARCQSSEPCFSQPLFDWSLTNSFGFSKFKIYLCNRSQVSEAFFQTNFVLIVRKNLADLADRVGVCVCVCVCVCAPLCWSFNGMHRCIPFLQGWQGSCGQQIQELAPRGHETNHEMPDRGQSMRLLGGAREPGHQQHPEPENQDSGYKLAPQYHEKVDFAED